MRGKGPIGADVLFYVFSEINFVKPAVVKLKLDTAFNRMASRFKKVSPYFGNVFLDSSAAGGGSFVDEFVEKFSDPETTLVVKPSIWEVKCDSGIYGNPTRKRFLDRNHIQRHFNEGGRIKIGFIDEGTKELDHPKMYYEFVEEMHRVPRDLDYTNEYEVDEGWFQVYLGDSTRDAFIVNRLEELPEGLDNDRFLPVPMELFSEFKLNLELSLQDHAGISTKSSNLFIQDREAIPETFKLPMRTSEIIEIDFYDRQDSIMNHLREAIKYIPKEKVLSVRFDIGVVSDYTGLAISYFDDWDVTDKKNKTRVPKFCTPIACAIGRKQGQETSIRMMYEFIKDLSKEFEIGAVTADQFQSRQLMQDLERDGFNAYLISVDRTDAPYQYLKQCMYERRIQCTQSRLLQREVRELIYQDMKVDHPQITKADNLTFGKGSKDCSDAWAGSIYAMTDNLEEFTYISKHYNRTSYLLNMKKQTVTNKQNIIKDAKKMMKTGGMERFLKKEMERKSLLHGAENVKLATEKSHRTYKSSFVRYEREIE